MKKINKSKIFMIIGISILIIAISGSAYAYYAASTSANLTGEAAGFSLNLTVTKLSTSATGNLIPVDNDTTTLTKAVKGYGFSGTEYDSSKSCIDKNGYTACQVYEITIENNGNSPVTVDGGVTLSGSNTPNIDCAKMADKITVSSNTSCIGKTTLASNVTLNKNASNTYYIVVYINNKNESQEDSGTFSGTVTFTSSTGSKVKAKFGNDDPALETLEALNLSVDTTHTPNFSTCSGNSCSSYDENWNMTTGHGDGTNGIYEYTDDLGTSYYFRGAVTNNYVSFANKTWRIVRINGDGTIRIALNESAGSSKYNTSYNDNAYVGYMYGTAGSTTYEATHANTNNSTIKTFLDNWYENNLKDTAYEDYIADSIFCNDRSINSQTIMPGTDEEMALTGNGIGTSETAYSALTRVNINFTPSLICSQANDKFTVSDTLGNGDLTYPIGLLTADEYLMAGAGAANYINLTCYYYESNAGAFYLYDNNHYYWTMSPFASAGGNAGVTGVDYDGILDDYLVSNNLVAVRPVVSLKSNAITGGTGASSDPFTVS